MGDLFREIDFVRILQKLGDNLSSKESVLSKLAGDTLVEVISGFEKTRVQKAILRLISELGGGEGCRLLEDGWVPDRYLVHAKEDEVAWVAAAICSTLDLDGILKKADASSRRSRGSRDSFCWEGLGAAIRGEPVNIMKRGNHVFLGFRNQRPGESTPAMISSYKGGHAELAELFALPDMVHLAGFTFDVRDRDSGPVDRAVLLWASNTLFKYSGGTLWRIRGDFPDNDTGMIKMGKELSCEVALSERFTTVGCSLCFYLMPAETGSVSAVWRILEGFSNGLEAMNFARLKSTDRHPEFAELREVFSKGNASERDKLGYQWSCRNEFKMGFQDGRSAITPHSLTAISKLGEATPGGLLISLHERSHCNLKSSTSRSSDDGRGIIAAYIYSKLNFESEAASSSVTHSNYRVLTVIAPYGTSISVPGGGCVVLSFPEEEKTIRPWVLYQPFDRICPFRLKDLPHVVKLLGFERNKAVVDELVGRLSDDPYLLTIPYGPRFLQALKTKCLDKKPSISAIVQTPGATVENFLVDARCVREALGLMVTAGGYVVPNDGKYPCFIQALDTWKPSECVFNIGCDERVPLDGIVCPKYANGDIELWYKGGIEAKFWFKVEGGTHSNVNPRDKMRSTWQRSMLSIYGASEVFWDTEELLRGPGKLQIVRGSPSSDVVGFVVLDEFMVG